MSKSGNKCYNCKYFDRYFTKGMKQFNKTKFGWCCKSISTVTAHGCCEKYVFKPKSKKINVAVERALNDLLTELSEIRKVIEEEGGRE